MMVHQQVVTQLLLHACPLQRACRPVQVPAAVMTCPAVPRPQSCSRPLLAAALARTLCPPQIRPVRASSGSVYRFLDDHPFRCRAVQGMRVACGMAAVPAVLTSTRRSCSGVVIGRAPKGLGRPALDGTAAGLASAPAAGGPTTRPRPPRSGGPKGVGGLGVSGAGAAAGAAALAAGALASRLCRPAATSSVASSGSASPAQADG